MKSKLPVLLSLNAGYVDTAAFLALQGLFTAHVTGNFVTLGAALVLGTSGAMAKLLALPMFCIAVMFTRVLGHGLAGRNLPVLRAMLILELVLLVAGAALAIRLGPFANGDGWPALVTGMVLVSAMAIQNAVQRIHLASSPPTTIMTGTTTQIMIDLADLMRDAPSEMRIATQSRLLRMLANVAAFAAGCAGAAWLFGVAQIWCFLVPPLLGLIAVLLRAPAEAAA
jgi:uncharacterized membrane protein YoaK (UPF0700 family)